MKKTYKELTPTLTQVTVEQNGQELVFLNGVIQMQTGSKFIPAKGPMNGELMLIIEDYAWWHVNHHDVTEWMRANLPRGEEHCAGMVIHFDNEEQRTWFVLKWQ